MKHVIFVLSLAATAILAGACKKDKPTEPPTVYPNYGALKTGNYWVYERYQIDPDGNETLLSFYDSCYIEKDTLIAGKTYFKSVRPDLTASQPPVVEYFRDSLHYIVNSYGSVVFSSEDFSTVFHTFEDPNGTYTLSTQMVDKDFVVSTPYGLFTTSAFRKSFQMEPPFDNYGNPRNMYIRYAKGVGIVHETLPFYLGNGNTTERRLVRYHVNQ